MGRWGGKEGNRKLLGDGAAEDMRNTEGAVGGLYTRSCLSDSRGNGEKGKGCRKLIAPSLLPAGRNQVMFQLKGF